MTLTPHAAEPAVVVRMAIGGDIVQRRAADEVLSIVNSRLRSNSPIGLAVGSVNLDDLHHFRRLGAAASVGRPQWLLLADGMPIALRGRVLTSVPRPRITGANLLRRILELAARRHQRVAVLGGQTETHMLLADKLSMEYPGLTVAGFWSPDRDELEQRSDEIAAEIAAARPDILVVSLGKPRQELWVDRFGPATGAKVFLPFGAATDFLVGTANLVPQWMRRSGFQWPHRLTWQRRRLASR